MKELKFGSNGDKIKRLQERLKELNYYHGNIDGIFSMSLESSVKNWQKDNYFKVTGVIDLALWEIIFQKNIRNSDFSVNYSHFPNSIDSGK